MKQTTSVKILGTNLETAWMKVEYQPVLSIDHFPILQLPNTFTH